MMKRSVASVATSILLLFAVATVALWIRIYWNVDEICHGALRRSHSFYSFRGHLGYVIETGWGSAPTAAGWQSTTTATTSAGAITPGTPFDPLNSILGFNLVGFNWIGAGAGAGGYGTQILVPDWFLILLFALFPIWYWIPKRLRATRARGFEIGPPAKTP
jgi:hypothetical protein